MSKQIADAADPDKVRSATNRRDSSEIWGGDAPKVARSFNASRRRLAAGALLQDVDDFVAGRLSRLLGLLCRTTRQSNAAVARLFWFLAAIDGYCHATNFVSLITFSGMTAFMLVAGSLHADRHTRSRFSFRVLGLGLLLLFIIRALLTRTWAGTEFWLFVLFAQYAPVATIPYPRHPDGVPPD